MPIKHDTKKTSFCTSNKKYFAKYSMQDTHCWGMHSVMNPFGDLMFQDKRVMIEGDDKSSGNFEI